MNERGTEDVLAFEKGLVDKVDAEIKQQVGCILIFFFYVVCCLRIELLQAFRFLFVCNN